MRNMVTKPSTASHFRAVADCDVGSVSLFLCCILSPPLLHRESHGGFTCSSEEPADQYKEPECEGGFGLVSILL